MADIPDSERAVHEYVARINAHDAGGTVALSTADHVLIDSLGSRLSGGTRLEQGWRGYSTLFPELKEVVDRLTKARR